MTKPYFELFFIVQSDNQLYTGHFNEPLNYPKKNVRRAQVILDFDDSDVKTMVTNIIQGGNIHQEVMKIAGSHVDMFYHDKELYLFSKGLDTKSGIENITRVTKKRVKDITGKQSFIKPETFIKKYNLRGGTKTIPYTNYSTNESENNRCVLQYVNQKYKKASKKIVNKFFDKDDVTVQDIEDFCEKYKISYFLRNILGRTLTSSKKDTNKNYPDFHAIISDNHLYPCDSNKNYYPTLPKNEILDEDGDIMLTPSEDDNDDVAIQQNNKIYTHEGIVVSDDADKLDEEFFKGIQPNFTHLSEQQIAPLPLYYGSGEFCKTQLDMKKAYYNIYMNRINKGTKIPIFTAMDVWEKMTVDHTLSDVNYYLLNEESVKTLSQLGFRNNFCSGYMLKFLINTNRIKNSATHFKRPSMVQPWGLYVVRLNKSADRLTKTESDIKTMEDIKTEEETEKFNDYMNEKIDKFKKEYALYNGILGKKWRQKTEVLGNVPETDEVLINHNLDDADKWQYEGNRIYSRIRRTYKYLNTCNVYNMVVEMCNMMILQDMDKIKEENPHARVVKIKTDCIGFDSEIKIPSSIEKWYKYETPSSMKSKDEQQIIDGEKIVANTINELSKCNNNISYHGAPGTGKTYTVKNNHTYDKSATSTNMCCKNMGNDATTLYSLFGLYDPANLNKCISKLKNKTVWIDEWSMVPNDIWNYLYLSCQTQNTKLIISGDINQIGPVKQKKPDVNSVFLKFILGEQHHLEKDYRNDKELINLRNKILKNHPDRLRHLMSSEIEHSTPYTAYKRHISFTHNARIAINQKILDENGYKYKHTKNEDGSYGKLIVSNGVILNVGKSFKSAGIFKNEMWEVLETNGNTIKLKSLINNEIMDMNDSYGKYFTLGFCVTSHSAQGLTIVGDMCVHESLFMVSVDKDILYTAVTRGCKRSNVHIYAHKRDHYDKTSVTYTTTEPDYTEMDYEECGNEDANMNVL